MRFPFGHIGQIPDSGHKTAPSNKHPVSSSVMNDSQQREGAVTAVSYQNLPHPSVFDIFEEKNMRLLHPEICSEIESRI